MTWDFAPVSLSSTCSFQLVSWTLSNSHNILHSHTTFTWFYSIRDFLEQIKIWNPAKVCLADHFLWFYRASCLYDFSDFTQNCWTSLPCSEFSICFFYKPDFWQFPASHLSRDSSGKDQAKTTPPEWRSKPNPRRPLTPETFNFPTPVGLLASFLQLQQPTGVTVSLR